MLVMVAAGHEGRASLVVMVVLTALVLAEERSLLGRRLLLRGALPAGAA